MVQMLVLTLGFSLARWVHVAIFNGRFDPFFNRNSTEKCCKIGSIDPGCLFFFFCLLIFTRRWFSEIANSFLTRFHRKKKTLWNFAFSHIDSTWTSWFVIEITIFFLDLFKKKMIRKTLIGNQAKLLAIFWWFFFRILKLRSIDSLSLSIA